jgi:RimJ/RimL family protein N-acetyltransferase
VRQVVFFGQISTMNNLQGNDRRKKNVFESERLLLRPLKISDAWNVYINIRDPEIGRFNITPPSRYFNNKAGKIIRRCFQLFFKAISVICHKLHLPIFKRYVKLGIVLKDTGKVIGVASAENIDNVNKTASVGFWIGKRYWGKGIMFEAMPLLLDYCFAVLGMHKLWGEAHSENKTSLKNCSRLGFQTEGILRKERYINGEWIDVIRIGLLQEDWQSWKESKSK